MNTTSTAHLNQSLPEVGITATKVTNAVEQMQCLPKVCGRNVDLENAIDDALRLMSDDPDGHHFECYRLSNGGFYMAPIGRTSYRFRLGANYFDGAVSANTAGIIATAAACRDLSLDSFGTCFAFAYQLLSEFISQHPDALTIRTALGELVGSDF